MSKKQCPEAFVQFTDSAREGERRGVMGSMATWPTEPTPTDPKAKLDVATRILADDAMGEDFSSEETVEGVPDRILARQNKSKKMGTDNESTSQRPNNEAPGRMSSPSLSGEAWDSDKSIEKGATDLTSEALDTLVNKGFSREAAENLLAEMGPSAPSESLSEWSQRITGDLPTKGRRKQILAEHHETGLPPLELPPREES
jgi:hypothetical protein